MARVVAISGPMPGNVIGGRAAVSSRARREMSASSPAIRSPGWRRPSTGTCNVARAVSGSASSSGPTSAIGRRAFQAPCGTTAPNAVG
jgi:hypothetical protein